MQLHELATRVIAELEKRGLSLATAESLTGGLVAATLVSVPGASAVVRGGVVAYATDVKHTVLGVDADLLDAHGAVHPEVAEQMASGARRVCAADIGIATTGVAGPEPSDGQPVGRVWVAVEGPEGASVRGADLSGTREEIRMASVELALETVLTLI